MKFEFTNYDGNDKDYAWVICKCSKNLQEGIRIPRADYNGYIKFNCPRCNESLGIYIKKGL